MLMKCVENPIFPSILELYDLYGLIIRHSGFMLNLVLL